MKSIRSKILLSIIVTVTVSLVFLGAVSILLIYRSTENSLTQSMSETVLIAGERVQQELRLYSSLTDEIGKTPSMSDDKVTLFAKQTALDERIAAYGLRYGGVLDQNGRNIFDGKMYNDRTYFEHAVAGQSYVSGPVVSRITGEMSIVVASPIWQGGRVNGTVAGVVYMVPPESFLNEIVARLKVSENSIAYLIDKEGTTIAAADPQLVADMQNITAMATTDSTLQPQADLHREMMAGRQGTHAYRVDGMAWVNAYAPIPGTDGWSLLISTPLSDFKAGMDQSFWITTLVILLSAALAVAVAIVVAGRITKPLKACAVRLGQLAEGDLHSPVPTANTKDEAAQLLRDLDRTVTSLRTVVEDISLHTTAIAAGDLSGEMTMQYTGDFAELSDALGRTLAGLNVTLAQIYVSADQVRDGTEQLQSGTQMLSEGAVQQASALQELSASLGEISGKVQQTAQNAHLTHDKAQQTGAEISSANDKMMEMISSMDNIAVKTHQISKIIKTIDEIAFQTNILALNAAVEAARAGVAGKGFAVVAGEVRNLAQRSAAAAQSTTGLIEEMTAAVGQGTQIAGETAQSLVSVMEQAGSAIQLVDSITEATGSQSQGISEITAGVEEISAVVQTNSATAEQSAAACEELSSQSQMLRELVGQFRLQAADSVRN